ncbi:uncharacterized protein LOC142348360 isoform X3 [Convolutriloba macropyga]
MKPEIPDDHTQYGFEFEFLATAIPGLVVSSPDEDWTPDSNSRPGLGSDNVFSPDGSIRRFSLRSPAPLKLQMGTDLNASVNSTAAIATTGITPLTATSGTFGRTRLASNASTLSTSMRVQRLPSVSEIGFDLMDRFLNRQGGSTIGRASGSFAERYAVNEETLDSNCRENNLVIGGGGAAGVKFNRQSSFSPNTSMNRSGGMPVLSDSQNFGSARHRYLPKLAAEEETIREDSTSLDDEDVAESEDSAAGSSDESRPRPEQIDDATEEEYLKLAKQKSSDSSQRPTTLGLAPLVDNNVQYKDERVKKERRKPNAANNNLRFTFDMPTPQEPAVQDQRSPAVPPRAPIAVMEADEEREKKRKESGSVTEKETTESGEPKKLSAAGSSIPMSRVFQLKQYLPAAGPRLKGRKSQVNDGRTQNTLSAKNKSRKRGKSGAPFFSLDTSGRSTLGTSGAGTVGSRAGRSTRGGQNSNQPIAMMNPKMRRLDSHVRDQITGIHHHRPYFTFWICSVHMLVLFTALVQHGLGPFGMGMEAEHALVGRKTGDAQMVALLEPQNVWIGPRPMELIKLGAKYTPCMAEIGEVRDTLNAAEEKEKETGCCVFMSAATTRSDGSTFCFQASEEDCVNKIATLDFFKYEQDEDGVGGGGPVCGLDPKYCELPSPVSHPWPHNITDWPICRKTLPSSDYHMTCKITARPCCFGPLGQCIMASRDYCGFVNGIYHPEAYLCSQVSCLSEVCGLFPFASKDHSTNPTGNPKTTPNQIYRLFTSLLVHAGAAQIVITLPLHWTFVRFMEILAGPFRTALIYFLSGISGNLVSSIVLPYQAQVGPYPCLFGILGSYFVELYQMNNYLMKPLRAWSTMFAICLFLFLLGLLPWLDNFMNFSGLLSGIALSLVFLPYIHLRRRDRTLKLAVSAIAGILYLSVNAFLFLILVAGEIEWKIPSWVQTLTCIPFTTDFCSHLKTELKTG